MDITAPPSIKIYRADTFDELGHNLHHFTAPSAALCQFHLRKGAPGTHFFTDERKANTTSYCIYTSLFNDDHYLTCITEYTTWTIAQSAFKPANKQTVFDPAFCLPSAILVRELPVDLVNDKPHVPESTAKVRPMPLIQREPQLTDYPENTKSLTPPHDSQITDDDTYLTMHSYMIRNNQDRQLLLGADPHNKTTTTHPPCQKSATVTTTTT